MASSLESYTSLWYPEPVALFRGLLYACHRKRGRLCESRCIAFGDEDEKGRWRAQVRWRADGRDCILTPHIIPDDKIVVSPE